MQNLKKTILILAAILSVTGAVAQNYASHSRLATGQWFKIPVSNTGVYKITTREVSALNLVPCSQIALYGQPGGMLSASNVQMHPDDLQPAAAEVVDVNGNGLFDEDD